MLHPCDCTYVGECGHAVAQASVLIYAYMNTKLIIDRKGTINKCMQGLKRGLNV
jgi:hypothetical protein